jgi:hypothetical protein
MYGIIFILSNPSAQNSKNNNAKEDKKRKNI